MSVKTTTTYPAYGGCTHVPDMTLFTAMGVELRAGQASEAGGQSGLFLACAPLVTAKVLTVPVGFEELNNYEPKREVIRVVWNDFGVPALNAAFWLSLLELSVSNGHDVLSVVCVGGHGRTGTALSALGIVGKGWTAEHAVNFLRDRYCKEVVESTSQVSYLVGIEKWAMKEGILKKQGKRPQTAWVARPIPGGYVDSHKPAGGYSGVFPDDDPAFDWREDVDQEELASTMIRAANAQNRKGRKGRKQAKKP